MGIGFYDDARYRTRNVLTLPASGSLAGTAAAAADVVRKKVMFPIRIIDAVGYCSVGGTETGAGVQTLTVNSSLAGTGDLVPLGTMTIGTQADLSSQAIAITECSLAAEDEIVIQRAIGTSTAVTDVQLDIGYREVFA